jgi:Eukaryotic aspartyl protease
LFITQLADGIMGMDVAPAAFWSQMYDANKIQHKAFSLCFSRKDAAERTGTEAGAMSLGGTDPRLHATPLVYTTTSEGSGFYVVHVRKMYLREGGGGTSARSTNQSLKVQPLDLSEDELNAGRVIVDSGTTVR